MREKDENTFHETEAAFAFAVVLLNLLIFAALGGIVWLMQLLISHHSPLGTALGEAVRR